MHTIHAARTRLPQVSGRPLRLVGVWAHPDDEAYLSAGLMARVRDLGGEVTVVTATGGEHGTDDPALAGTAAFAARRTAELRDSLAELGVADLRLLGLPDGGCADQDASAMAAWVAEVLDELRPDVVVTFGPEGMTGHADHRAVSRWATDAWRDVGVGELWYATKTEDFMDEFAATHDELGVFADLGPGDVLVTPIDRLSSIVRLDGADLDRKRRALARHASQTERLAAAMGESTYRRWLVEEAFRRPTPAELASPHVVDAPVVRVPVGAS